MRTGELYRNRLVFFLLIIIKKLWKGYKKIRYCHPSRCRVLDCRHLRIGCVQSRWQPLPRWPLEGWWRSFGIPRHCRLQSGLHPRRFSNAGSAPWPGWTRRTFVCCIRNTSAISCNDSVHTTRKSNACTCKNKKSQWVGKKKKKVVNNRYFLWWLIDNG